MTQLTTAATEWATRSAPMKVKILGYPILFASPYTPTAGVEEVISPRVLEYSLRERANIQCLLNHDKLKPVAALDDGSLRLTVESAGVRAEVGVDDSTPARRELLAALDAGTIRGGSFGWTMLRNRWHLDRSPVRVEVVDALVREVTIVTAPHSPRYKATWAAELGPCMESLYRRLDQQRIRCGARASDPEPAADLVLTLEPPSYGMWGPVMRLLEDHVEPEWRAVREAARRNPRARIIDVRYARTLKSCEEVMRRRFPPPVAAHSSPIPPAPPPAPSRPIRAPRGGCPMSKIPEPLWDENEVERRPAAGYGRPSDTAAALRSLKKYREEYEARQRGDLTVTELRERIKKSKASW
jgi:HK97 family phage prohead protease